MSCEQLWSNSMGENNNNMKVRGGEAGTWWGVKIQFVYVCVCDNLK